MNLYINACPREDSRTDRLARKVLEKFESYDEIYLPELNLQPLSRERLDYRTKLIEAGNYEDPIFDFAKQFASADNILIAAPYWDLSFPSCLKLYIENIYVTGLVSRFSQEGRPVGLCKAENLYYVTSAGGPYDSRFSYDYIEALAKNAFGIGHTELIKAEMLDVDGFDVEEILREAWEKYKVQDKS